MRVFFTTLILLGLSFLLLVACSSPPPSTSRSASYVVDGSEDTGTSWRRSTPSQVMIARSEGLSEILALLQAAGAKY